MTSSLFSLIVCAVSLRYKMVATSVRGLWQHYRIWMFCVILSVLLQISAAADGGVAEGDACSAVTLDKLESTPCKLGGLDIEVTYRNRKLVCGAVEPKKGVADEPTFLFTKADKKKIYTLMMLDADAPNDGDLYYRHWLVADISGEDLLNGRVNNGRVLTEYTPPTPPSGTGKHRYQFFVLEQTNVQVKPPKPKAKGKFDPVAFCEDYGLCGPTAAFEFITEF